MKLLLDENLSDRVVARILDPFPGSAHIKAHGLLQADDSAIWSFARQHGYTLVSKDSDFYQRALVVGAPPKIVFLRVGNGPTTRIIHLLRSNVDQICALIGNPDASVLILA